MLRPDAASCRLAANSSAPTGAGPHDSGANRTRTVYPVVDPAELPVPGVPISGLNDLGISFALLAEILEEGSVGISVPPESASLSDQPGA